MSRVFCKKWLKLNIFPYLIDFLPFLLQVLSLYVYAIYSIEGISPLYGTQKVEY